jgi:hypothetical protein
VPVCSSAPTSSSAEQHQQHANALTRRGVGGASTPGLGGPPKPRAPTRRRTTRGLWAGFGAGKAFYYVLASISFWAVFQAEIKGS